MSGPGLWASEASHWYDLKTGEPRHTIIGKNGKERATTLRDAKQHGYVPSVTKITGCAYRFSLERWKAEQVLMAALTLPRNDGESEADWIGRVWEDSQEQARKAAERGTEIHAAIEAWYRGDELREPLLGPWVRAADEAIRFHFGENVTWSAEKSFVQRNMGYGGKVDLHTNELLLDIKTKDDLGKAKVWDENLMQLGAYRFGLAQPWDAPCGILFVDRNTPKAVIEMVNADDLKRGFRMFSHLLEYWKAANL